VLAFARQFADHCAAAGPLPQPLEHQCWSDPTYGGLDRRIIARIAAVVFACKRWISPSIGVVLTAVCTTLLRGSYATAAQNAGNRKEHTGRVRVDDLTLSSCTHAGGVVVYR
jgi:hypothetical protein